MVAEWWQSGRVAEWQSGRVGIRDCRGGVRATACNFAIDEKVEEGGGWWRRAKERVLGR